MEIQFFGDNSQFGHILLLASRVTADEIGDDLLAQVLLCVDAVENLLEFLELLEGWLAHEVEHLIAGMFWRYLQPAANMLGNQFFGVLSVGFVHLLILVAMQQEIVADTATDEALLDAW